MLNLGQQRMALGYALIFLRNEIEGIEESIEQCEYQESKDLLVKRYEELKLDLAGLQSIGDYV